MQPWTTLARDVVLPHGTFLTVENHTVQLPDGRIISDWAWLVMPSYVNVVVELEDGRFVVFRQTKYAVDGETLAPVGGYLEPGEDPLAAAQREVMEEAGCEAPEWISLGQYACDGNRGAGTAHLFLARGARRMADPDADDLEEQELLVLDRLELRDALERGEFKVLGWAAAVALALVRLRTLEMAVDPGS